MLGASPHDSDSPLANDLHSSHPHDSNASQARVANADRMAAAMAQHPDAERVSVPGVGPPGVRVAGLIPVLSAGDMDPPDGLAPDDDYSFVTLHADLAHSHGPSPSRGPLSHNN